MAIPIVATPTYELKLPSSGKKIKYRPFLVKEEKVLLLAMETKDPAQIQSTTKTVIHDCTFGGVDVENCPPFDLEYIVLQLRIKSVGEKISPSFKCSECNTQTAVDIDLTKVEVVKTANHSNTIHLTDKMGVVMRYPTIEDTVGMESVDEKDTEKNAERTINLIASCIEVIFDNDKIYKTKDFSKEEVIGFVENMSQDMFQKIVKFYQDIPAIKHEINFACPKCGHENKYTLRGMQDFFTS
jgi:transcription elongation factor Elf1